MTAIKYHSSSNFEPLPYTPLISSDEIQKLFGISSTTLWRWERKGIIARGMRVSGGRKRWHREDVDALLRKLNQQRG